MKKAILWLLALSLCLLAACSGEGKTPETEPPAGTAPSTEPSESVSTEPSGEGSEAQDFYDYLNAVVVPTEKLAFIGARDVLTDIDFDQANRLEMQGMLGLLSASVRDFDGDGEEEMITLGLVNEDGQSSFLGDAGYFTQPSYCLMVEMCLYEKENGQVLLRDTVPAVTLMECHSWGPMVVGLEQIDSTIYIFAKTSMTDMQTYGPHSFTVYHVEDGKFVLDYLDGVMWGQSSVHDAAEKAGASGLVLEDYTLYDIAKSAQKLESQPDEALKELGDRKLAYVQLEMSDGDQLTFRYQATDYTSFQQQLATGAQEVKPLPEGGKREHLPAEEQAMEQFQKLVEQMSGSFEEPTSVTDNGQITITAKYGSGSFQMRFDAETLELLNLSLRDADYPASSQWYGCKDVLLQAEALGLDQSVIAPMLGQCNLTTYLNGVEAGPATVHVGQVADTFVLIEYPQ